MKISGFTFLAVAIGLALSAPAHAKILRTAPASSVFANAVLICQLANTGDDAVVNVEARSYGGTLVGSSAPFHLSHLKTGQWYAPEGAAYCKFDIVAGSPKRIRAQAIYADLVTGYRMVAVPAR
jgi:hypothetical protein